MEISNNCLVTAVLVFFINSRVSGSMSDTNGDTALPRVEEEDPLEMDKITGSNDSKMKINGIEDHLSGMSSPLNADTTLSDIIAAPPPPTLSMVTKHLNGSLNLWQLTFGDKTKFSQVRPLERVVLQKLPQLSDTHFSQVLNKLEKHFFHGFIKYHLALHFI